MSIVTTVRADLDDLISDVSITTADSIYKIYLRDRHPKKSSLVAFDIVFSTGVKQKNKGLALKFFFELCDKMIEYVVEQLASENKRVSVQVQG